MKNRRQEASPKEAYCDKLIAMSFELKERADRDVAGRAVLLRGLQQD